jgi:hypothetical protein
LELPAGGPIPPTPSPCDAGVPARQIHSEAFEL